MPRFNGIPVEENLGGTFGGVPVEEEQPKEQDGALKRGWNKMIQSVGITGALASGDAESAAQKIAESARYQQANPGTPEGNELMAAWQRGDGISGGMSEVAGEFKNDWRAAPSAVQAIRSTGANLAAMGSGVVEQIPNMIPPMTGMLGGGAAGSVVGPVGTVGGAWAGASTGNTLVEGGGMAQEALHKAGINPLDTEAVRSYLAKNGDTILTQAGIKGAVIGAVDVATMGIAGKLLTAPAKAATGRALVDMGVDLTDKAAVQAAIKSPELAAKVAADPLYKAATTGAQGVTRNVTAAALEPAGEFTGEYLGQGLATGEYDEKEAFLEAASSIGQSGATFSGQKAYAALKYPFKADKGSDAPAGGAPGPTADDVLGTPEPTPAAPTEAEKALYTPKNLTALDRVAEIDAKLTNDGQDVDKAEVEALQTERDSITASWPKYVYGNPTTVTLPSGAKVAAHWAVVDASEPAASHDIYGNENPRYDKELQPRERGNRHGYMMQVSKITQNLDPDLLFESPLAGTGAPTLRRDGPVVDGNGRESAIQAAYQANGLKAESLRNHVHTNAPNVGIPAEAIAHIPKPQFVRVIDHGQGIDYVEYSKQANGSIAARMSPSEQARSDAAQIDSLDDLNPTEAGDFSSGSSAPFVRRFMAKLPATEQAGLIDANGQLSQSGYTRIRNAVLAKAYGDSPVLQRMVESLDSNIRNVGTALLRVAPHVAKTREAINEGALHDADLTPDLMAAVEELSTLKDKGTSVTEALAQAGMFGDKLTPESRELLAFMDENIRSPKRIAEFIQSYLEALQAAGNPAQGSMFGDTAAPAKVDLIAAARRIANGDTATGGAAAGNTADGQARGEQSQDPQGHQAGARGNETSDQQLVDQLNTLNPQLKTKLTVTWVDESDPRVAQLEKTEGGKAVGGHNGSSIILVRGRANRQTLLHEIRHMIDMLLGGYELRKWLKSDAELMKRVVSYLKGERAAGRLDSGSRMTDVEETAQSLLDAYYRNKEGLRAEFPDIVQFLEQMGADKYASIMQEVGVGETAQQGEWLTFPPDTGTLGIPRAEMPQIKGDHRGALIQFLQGRGITHETVEMPASELKPTQAEFSVKKVEGWKEARDGVDRSVLASSDGYILDGHHQWVAALAAGETEKVIRFDAPIQELLAAVREFPSVKKSEGAKPKLKAELRQEIIEQQWNDALADLGVILRDFAQVARMVPEDTPNLMPTLVKLFEAGFGKVGMQIGDLMKYVKAELRKIPEFKTVWNKLSPATYRKAAAQALENHQAAPQGDLFAGAGKTMPGGTAMIDGRQYDRDRDNFKSPHINSFLGQPAIDGANAAVEKYYKGKPGVVVTAEERSKAESLLMPLIAKAEAVKEEYDQKIIDITKRSGAIGQMLAPIKSMKRSVEKLVDDEDFDISGMKDMLRSTIVVSSYDDVQAVMNEIEREFSLLRDPKNRTGGAPIVARGKTIEAENPEAYGGYSDVMVNVVMPSGVIAEIQINVPEMIGAKEGPDFKAPGHKLYEAYREAPKESPLGQEIKAEMEKYYAAVRSAISARRSASDLSHHSDTGPRGPSFGLNDNSLPSSDNLNHLPSGNSTKNPPSDRSPNRQPSGNLSGTFISSTSNNSISQTKGNFNESADAVAAARNKIRELRNTSTNESESDALSELSKRVGRAVTGDMAALDALSRSVASKRFTDLDAELREVLRVGANALKERATDAAKTASDVNAKARPDWLPGKARPAEVSPAVRKFHEKWGGGKLGVGETVTAEENSAVESQSGSKIDQHEALFDRLRDGTVTLDEFKAGFSAVVDGKEAIKSELSALTKGAIFKRFPGIAYRYKNDKKDVVVGAAYRSMLDSFVLGDSIQWHMGEKYEDVIRGYVEKTTEESLREFADKVKTAKEERAAQRKIAEVGMENPVTLDDYKRILAAKAQEIGEGATFGQARMAMTPEQRARFDELTAEQSRGDRKARANQQRSEVRVAAATAEGQIVETKHTKTGEPLFVVKAAERVEREVYNQWNATAKKLGGWYSSFRGNGAVPGFQFKTRENAESFLKYLGGDVEQAKEAAQARRDAFEDDKGQSAVERLNEMADRLDEQAGEALSADRKTNTARRARFAAGAEAVAHGQQAMAQTMRNIAAAIETGQAKFLDRVRQKVQIERMQAWLASAQYDEQRAKYPTYAEQEKHRGEKPTGETADYATFTQFTAFRSDLARMARRLLEIDGAKLLGTRLLKVADDVTAEYKKFAKENLHKVSTFKTQDGKAAVFRTADDAGAAIARSGFKGKATVISFKRGEHLVIMGPEMAKEAGLWHGDPDKRITLAPDFADEIVAKAKGRDIGMPWIFETVAADRARLKAMGIETPAEFRAALREFIAMRETPKAPDRVKELERKMIGRANDGLDFFPTPAETAQAMIDAADLKEGMAVLEPSAGWGNIAEKIREAGVEPDVVELSGDRRELLEAKGFNLIGNDFMDVAGEYDRIIMNPPFGDRRDAEHVQHAYSLLKPGGRLVAIMGEGVFYGQDKKAQAFREWLESVGGTSEKLEEGTFLDSSLPVNTGVNARMVVIDNATGGVEPRLSRAVPPAPTFKLVDTNSPEFKRWFGDWELAALGKTMRRSRGSDQASINAKEFIGKPLRNRETGVEATVSNGAFGKMKSRVSVVESVSPQAHMQALGNIDKLFELATLDAERTPKKSQDAGDIGAVQHYKVPMPFDGDVLLVKMMVKQFIDPEKGNRLYLVQAVEIENAGIVGEDPVVSGQFQSGVSAESSPPSGVNQRLVQMIEAVKGGASKVVDDNGDPMVVYHATLADFTGFEAGREAENSSTFGSYKTSRMGIFFAEDESFSEEFVRRNGRVAEGANVIQVYLRIKNALDLTDGFQGLHKNDFDKLHDAFIKDNYWAVNLNPEEVWELFDTGTVGGPEFVDAVRSLGFDGVKMIERRGDGEATNVWVAFSPTQIKSATSNTGEFSDTNPDIRQSRGTGIGMALRDLQAVVDRIANGFKNLPRVHVLSSPSDLSTKDPAQKALRDFIKKAGAWDDVEGATHEGEIYLFASGMADEARAEFVLAEHEVTHYGLRGTMGKELDSALQHIYLFNGKVRVAADKMKKARGLKSNVEAVEEVLADMPSADLAKLRGWRKVVQVVRNWLNKAGAKNLAARLDAWMKAGLTDQEKADLFVADLVGAARQWVKSGKNVSSGIMGGTRLADPRLADDLAAQEKWLDREAKMRGYKSIDELAEKDYPAFENLAKLWRKKHPVEEALLSRVAAEWKSADNPPEPGKPFMVYRLARGGELSLDGKNAADAEGLAAFIMSTEDFDSSISSDGDTIYAYEVTADEFGQYETYNKGRASNKSGKVGMMQKWGGHWLSFPDGAKYQSRMVGTFGLEQARAKLQTMHGEHFFDNVGAIKGADTIREIMLNDFDGMNLPRLSRSTGKQSFTVGQQADAIIGKKAGTPRPLDAMMKGATQVLRIDKLTAAAYGKAAALLDRWTPETIKAGMVSDYGIPEAVIDARAVMEGRQRQQLRGAGKLIEKLSTLTRAESRVAYEWMNNDDPQAAEHFEKQLPEESVKVLKEVRDLIDQLSKEAIRLGQLSPEAYERNKFAYLRRSYVKHTAELTKGETKGRARAISILGDQYKGRGMTDAVDMAKFKAIAPEWWNRKLKAGQADKQLKGEKFIRLERRAPIGTGTTPLDGMTGPQPKKQRLLEVAYWPAGETIPARYGSWDQAGTWEVRDTKGGKLVVWRDFTKQEREAMGEIDEARYAIAKTLHGMIHDVEVGNYLEWLGQKYAKKDGDAIDGTLVEASERMRDTFKPGEWVQVPDTKIPGTQVKKYGTLAGRYLPGPIWNDVRQIMGGRFKPLGDTYAAIHRAWKTSKTALSPAVHMNNVMANFVMADWHDVTAGHILKALKLMTSKDAAAADVLARFGDSGGTIGTWATKELQQEQLRPLLEALEKELGIAGNVSGQVGVMSALQLALKGKMSEAWASFTPSKTGQVPVKAARALIDLYEAEDQVFRLAAWLKAKEEGASDLQAGKAARKSFLDYSINAPWVQMMRGTAFPFIAFTYRSVPMLLDVAAKKPWKLMKLGMVFGAINALGYMLSGGDEDDERKLLPEEKAGRIWGITPKLVRMPWNDDNGAPVFLDVRRWIPVGDIFDTGATHAALPILPMMQPGGPLMLLAEFSLDKTGFTGKGITLETDTPVEKATKTADWLYKAFAPNIVLPNPVGYVGEAMGAQKGFLQTYAWTGVQNAGSGKTDSFGREQSLTQAIVSSVGIKVGSYPKDVLQLNAQREAQAKMMEIDRNITALKREYQKRGIEADEYQEKAADQMAKKRKIVEKLQGRMAGG